MLELSAVSVYTLLAPFLGGSLQFALYRYFTVAFMLLQLHEQSFFPAPEVEHDRGQPGAATAGSCDARLRTAVAVLHAGGLVAVNAALLALFLYKPFEWPDGSVARFLF
jgi:hypothetical protein